MRIGNLLLFLAHLSDFQIQVNSTIHFAGLSESLNLTKIRDFDASLGYLEILF